jgi:hypothetical protein
VKARESVELAAKRWEKLVLVQEHYTEFIPFLEDVMEELGFSTTAIQREIGQWIAHGPQYLMVQAQRGQAKTTIAAAFAVFSLVHNPACRVLVISAGGKQAVEISTLIVRLVLNMVVLSCMIPDDRCGDRTSVEAFDVHHSLKGLDKSPSVACVGIDSNLQGKRADLLIPDDIESSKNSATSTQRAKLLHLTKDFTSINSTGRIIWLGTPQTMESIYGSLPARGVSIRIWPGRYPTAEQRKHYGANLAPSLSAKIAMNPSVTQGGGLNGDQGQPTDPQLLDEAALQKKERDQMSAYFQLQHMLNTALSDAMRFPLKPNLIVALRGAGARFPMIVVRGMESSHLLDYCVADHAFQMSAPHELSKETASLQSTWAYVDPAAGGANGDETAFAIGGFLNGNIHVLSVGGLPGGYEESKLRTLAKRLARFKLDGLKIEKNMGHGAFRAVFTPIMREYLHCQLEDDLVTGQKEARIIETLGPVMGRGSLIFDPAIVEEDDRDCERYSASLRSSYSLFYQLAKMTKTRGALVHDDKADALEGLVRHFQEALAMDQRAAVTRQHEREHAALMKDPMGYTRYKNPGPTRPNMLRHRRR